MKLKGTRLHNFRDSNLNFAAEGMPAVKKDDVRTHRPVGMRKGRWVLGDITEVLDRNSWRLGKIAKVLKDDYFVIRVTGCMQMREFHISCLRFPHAYHGKQSAVIDKVSTDSHALLFITVASRFSTSIRCVVSSCSSMFVLCSSAYMIISGFFGLLRKRLC